MAWRYPNGTVKWRRGQAWPGSDLAVVTPSDAEGHGACARRHFRLGDPRRLRRVAAAAEAGRVGQAGRRGRQAGRGSQPRPPPRPPRRRLRPPRRPLPRSRPRPPAAAAKPAAGTNVVTIRDHDWIQGTPGQPNDWYDKFIANWEKANPTIKIEREWFPRAEMHAKQLALAATGQIGDTVRINVAPKVSELQLKKVVHDLDSLWKDDKEWVDKDQKQFWTGQHPDLHPRGEGLGPAGRRPPGQRPVLHQQDDDREGRPEDAAGRRQLDATKT